MQIRGVGAESLVRQGRVYEAAMVARRAVTEADRAGSRLMRIYGYRAHGVVMAATGDLVLARHSLMNAMRTARRAGARCCLLEARLNWWVAASYAAQDRESEHVRRQLVRTLAALPDGLRRAVATHLSSATGRRDTGACGGAVAMQGARPVVAFTQAEQLSPDNEMLPGVFAVSRAMRELALVVRRAAGAPFPVLVVGESGTGKELAARRGGPALRRYPGRGGSQSGP